MEPNGRLPLSIDRHRPDLRCWDAPTGTGETSDVGMQGRCRQSRIERMGRSAPLIEVGERCGDEVEDALIAPEISQADQLDGEVKIVHTATFTSLRIREIVRRETPSASA